MKIKTIFAMTLVLATMSVFATEEVAQAPKVVIPESVLALHNVACPQYAERKADGYVLEEEYQLPGSEYSPVGPKLFILTCEMYAYNSEERAYIVDSYSTTPVAVTEVTNNKSFFATVSLMGAGFDPATNTLGTFSKGRGMGDCGQAATYTYSAYEQRFELTEARLKVSCDGEDTDWPVVYKK